MMGGVESGVRMDGNVYAASDKIDDPDAPKTGSVGTEQKPINPNQISGAVFGDDVYLKSGAQTVSDHNPDTGEPNPLYYSFMPGFRYPDGFKTTTPVSNSWRELK